MKRSTKKEITIIQQQARIMCIQEILDNVQVTATSYISLITLTSDQDTLVFIINQTTLIASYITLQHQ